MRSFDKKRQICDKVYKLGCCLLTHAHSTKKLRVLSFLGLCCDSTRGTAEAFESFIFLRRHSNLSECSTL